MHCAVLILLLLSPAFSAAAENPFIDWVESSHPAYPALKLGAGQAGLQGWEAASLRLDQPLPQASARILAATLRRDPKVSPQVKADLASLLPSEVELAGRELFSGGEEIRAALERSQRDLARIEASQAEGNLNPYTNPGLWLTFDSNFELVSFSGLAKSRYAQMPVGLASELRGQVGAASYRVKLDFAANRGDRGGYEFLGLYPGPDSAVTLLMSPFGFENVEMTLGFNSLILSKFIYSAPTFPYQSPFYQNGAKVTAIRADTPNGERNSQGFYLRKQGAQGAWIFSDLQVLLAPVAEANASFNHFHGYDGVVRLDVPALEFLPGTEDTRPYITAYMNANDPSQLITYYDNSSFYETPMAVPTSGLNLAYGLESQLSGGGTLIVEFASSSWSQENQGLYPQYPDQNLGDTAFYSNLSKSFGRFIAGFEYSAVGPRFVPGGNPVQGGVENRTTGLALNSLQDIDFRNGVLNSSWETVSQDPAWITNNSSRMALQASWLDSWGSFGVAIASSQQIKPSGPWVKGSNFFNNSPYNGFSYFQLFFNNYSYYAPGATGAPNSSLAAYNQTTTAPALHNGAPVSSPYAPGQVKWHDLEQMAWRNTTQTIWLSRTGPGDPNLRADSVKFYNTLRADLSLELGAIFQSSRKAHLQLFQEVRDTAEEMRLALGGKGGLLLQLVTGADFNWQFAESWEVVATLGRESWLSDFSYFPVRFLDETAGIGINALLTAYVDGLQGNLRLLAMRHADAEFPVRDFSGWKATIGATYVFSN